MNEAKIGEGVKFERIRRITGYLVGTLDRWNNGKTAEEKDRVKHGMPEGCSTCDKYANSLLKSAKLFAKRGELYEETSPDEV